MNKRIVASAILGTIGLEMNIIAWPMKGNWPLVTHLTIWGVILMIVAFALWMSDTIYGDRP